MSRTLILTLAAAATITVASFASSASYARGFSGGGHVGAGAHAGIGGHLSVGGRGGVGRLTGPGRPGPILSKGPHGFPGRPGFPGRYGWGYHDHGRWVFRGGRWIGIDPVVGGLPDAAPVSAAAPGPCTCLTKTYTQAGLVVFADMCTKETASAAIGGASSDATPVPPANSQSNDAAPVAPAADATQAPTTPNYAGLTYQDFLKANGQAAAQAPEKN
jgi:hypothetical protein